MTKYGALFFVFTALFLITTMYFDVILKTDSIYWLVGKLTWVTIITAGPLYIDLVKKAHSVPYVVCGICFGVLFLGFIGHDAVDKYKTRVCHEQFGKEFNQRRRRLGFPQIPLSWQVDSRWDEGISWHGKDSIGGHESKLIVFDKCVIDREDDEYALKPGDEVSRSMEVISQYAKDKGQDSIFFHYIEGNYNTVISREKADSIFDAEGIKKDY